MNSRKTARGRLRDILALRRARLTASKKHSVLSRIAKYTFILVVIAAVAVLLRKWLLLLLFTLLSFALGSWLPPIDSRDALIASQSTIIYDSTGGELYTIHGRENRRSIALADIPEFMQLATLAIEDDQFFTHPGFDADGLFKAVLSEFGLGSPRGGSTITQQFVKNAYLSNERSYTRKLKELLLAVQLERRFTKEEILELYLNRIPYGGTAFGVAAASQLFFAKDAKELTLVESAVLAGLPQAPSRYSPYGPGRALLTGSCAVEVCTSPDDPAYTPGRKDAVLSRMLAEQFITKNQFNAAWREGLTLEFESFREPIRAPHFVFYVRDQLEELYGTDVLERGGLRVFTSLNADLQKIAEERIAEAFSKDENGFTENAFGANNAALLATSTTTGDILAMVGSRDYFEIPEEDGAGTDGQTNLTQRLRQPGSSFKPFVYAASFEEGILQPASTLWDVETAFGPEEYTPQNYDGAFEGPTTVRAALAASRNVPAVKAAILLGEERVVSFANQLGFSVPENADFGPTIGLGAAEVTMLELTSGYQTIMRSGSRVPLRAIIRVTDASGRIIDDFSSLPEAEEAMNTDAAWLIRDVLADTSARPLGWNKYLELPGRYAIAKTGTANNVYEIERLVGDEKDTELLPSDVWTAGATEHITLVAWMGNNNADGMRTGTNGLTAVGPIWNDVMQRAHENLPASAPPSRPEGITEKRVSALTSFLAGPSTSPEVIISDVFMESAAPTEVEPYADIAEIDVVSGMLATSHTPPAAAQTAAFIGINSRVPSLSNWQEPVRQWLVQFAPSFGIGAVPEKNSTAHSEKTAANAPVVDISFNDGDSIEAGSRRIVPYITGGNGDIATMIIRIDGIVAARLDEAPFTARVTIPVAKRGQNISFEVEVWDELRYAAKVTRTLSVR